MSIQEILQATNGRLISANTTRRVFKNVSTDSRSIKPGDVFFALVGEKFDGHDYIADVIRKKAGAVIVSKKILSHSRVPVIQVKDTTKALGHLAQFYRRKFDIPVIAITGSAGKTTTKEMIAQVLSTQYAVLKNVKTENNHIGVPQTLLRLNKHHQAAVLECGTNQPGDIEWLAEIVQPTVVVYTNIGASHLEKLKNRQGVFDEKFKMVQAMTSDGTIVFNRDDEYLSRISRMKLTQNKITYSIENKSDYQAKQVRSVAPGRIHFSVHQQKYDLSAWARHNVYNALAAVACADALNIKRSNIKKSLKAFVNCPGRQEIKKFGDLTVIDDTYNANPISFKSAVDTLSAMNVKGRKILVCADMLELGKESRKYHAELGAYTGRSSIHKVLSTGSLARIISQSLRQKKSRMEVQHYQSFENLMDDLENMCRQGDAVLIKGSRGMRMEKIVDALNRMFSRQSKD